MISTLDNIKKKGDMILPLEYYNGLIHMNTEGDKLHTCVARARYTR